MTETTNASTENVNFDEQFRIAMDIISDNNNHNKDLSFDWIRYMTENNHPDSTNVYGYFFENGYFGEKDLPKAMDYYKRAAELGHSVAMSNYGYGLEKGYLGNEDLPEAMVWYKKSADLRNVLAMCNYANGLEKGYTGEVDLKGAIQWYNEALISPNNFTDDSKKMIKDVISKCKKELNLQLNTTTNPESNILQQPQLIHEQKVEQFEFPETSNFEYLLQLSDLKPTLKPSADAKKFKEDILSFFSNKENKDIAFVAKMPMFDEIDGVRGIQKSAISIKLSSKGFDVFILTGERIEKINANNLESIFQNPRFTQISNVKFENEINEEKQNPQPKKPSDNIFVSLSDSQPVLKISATLSQTEETKTNQTNPKPRVKKQTLAKKRRIKKQILAKKQREYAQKSIDAAKERYLHLR
ncbi:MAG: hypothetical protein Ta2D_02530 [Rickettsiales bacterium]|nr:MAG: hypothetical protein Ta2D_02530 [Rickettsiales bacterium]